MNLLLDTCALLALAAGSLPRAAREALEAGGDACISPVVVWEIAIKVKTGKLQLPTDPLAWAEALATRHSLNLDRHVPDISVFCAAADLPLIHRDPFDRVVVATALQRGFTILTSDRIIPTYPGVKVIW
ncbi:type II toxin-antitoxin system VapC family toxin [Luteolibacter flavescens]|uniref:Type II toxin-antitoxin system VapC family toxin n=1 Tax=Luteolibacter flavescens TaxID=1859460 RepID=A0ABT3FRR9_9BACT|nr:type II toxin-antitoxin system VapC family toxin [Luteolibacter flavescens]MCW1886284.1 type II toxin-antitoxin system VapC family toxin [Luteolibacter flavescens]